MQAVYPNVYGDGSIKAYWMIWLATTGVETLKLVTMDSSHSPYTEIIETIATGVPIPNTRSIGYSTNSTYSNPTYDYKTAEGRRDIKVLPAGSSYVGKTQAEIQNPVISVIPYSNTWTGAFSECATGNYTFAGTGTYTETMTIRKISPLDQQRCKRI